MKEKQRLKKYSEAIIKKFLKIMTGILKKRIIAKAVCFLIATGMFFYVRYEKEDIREYTANVLIKNIPYNMAVLYSNTETVNVIIKGYKEYLAQLPADINVFVDLTNATIGSNIYTINIDNTMFKNKNIKNIIRPRVSTIVLDENTYKNVAIKATTLGEATIGTTLKDIILTPNQALISGPKTIISKIKELEISPIDLNKKTNDFSILSSVVIPKYVKSDINKVNSSVIFTENIIIQEYRDVALNINGLDSRFEISSKEGLWVDKIVIEGSYVLMKSILDKGLEVSINLKDIYEEGTYSNIDVNIEVPPQVRVLSVKPSSFTVMIKERK